MCGGTVIPVTHTLTLRAAHYLRRITHVAVCMTSLLLITTRWVILLPVCVILNVAPGGSPNSNMGYLGNVSAGNISHDLVCLDFN